MRTIDTVGKVTEDGKLVVDVSSDIPVGEHHVVITILDEPEAGTDRWIDFPVVDVGPWPEGLSLRREDMYDDWGR